MLKLIYFLLLVAASAEDYNYHKVRNGWIVAVFGLGALQMLLKKNDRWVTLTLTCICFLALVLLYQLLAQLSEKKGLAWKLGGADVRLIPGMMLVQGWSIALTGIFVGLILAMGCYYIRRKKQREIPLVPWMSLGCLLVEIASFLM